MSQRIVAYRLAEEMTAEEIDSVAGGPYTDRRVTTTSEYGAGTDQEEDGPAWDF